MAERKPLSDILGTASGGDFRQAWAETEAAGDFEPLPAGDYVCHVVAGELGTTRNGVPEYRLEFVVLEGEHAGRRLFYSLYLTPAALPMTKRDLAKLGIAKVEQLEEPLPANRIRCRVRVAQRASDDGETYNRVRRFDVLRIDDAPPADPFAPDDDATADSSSATATEPERNSEPSGGATGGADDATTFDFGHNAASATGGPWE